MIISIQKILKPTRYLDLLNPLTVHNTHNK